MEVVAEVLFIFIVTSVTRAQARGHGIWARNIFATCNKIFIYSCVVSRGVLQYYFRFICHVNLKLVGILLSFIPLGFSQKVF